MNFTISTLSTTNDSEYLYSLKTNKIITSNKFINNVNSVILQVIDLDVIVPSSCFSTFIMVVSNI